MHGYHLLRADRRYVGGFSLMGMLAAIVLIAIMSLALYPNIAGTLAYGKRQTTQARLEQLMRGTTQAYKANAMAVDDGLSDGEIRFDGARGVDGDAEHTLSSGLSYQPGAAGNRMGQSGFEVIARYTSDDRATLVKDGFGVPFRVFISDPLTRSWKGRTIHYRTIAFVSNNGGEISGGAPELAPYTRFDDSSGELTLGDSDVGVVVNGYAIQLALHKKTLAKLRMIADRYESFFKAQQNTASDRSFGFDYFSAACPTGGKGADLYPDSSPVPNTCRDSFDYPGPGVTFSPENAGSCEDSRAITVGGGLYSTLGLSPSDTTSAWGAAIGYGNGEASNCGGGVMSRSPGNPDDDYARPPYTALINAWAPGGESISVVASGA